MSAHLALMEAKVTLFNRTWKNVEALAARGGGFVKSNENVHGFGKMAQVTSDIEIAVKNSQLIMLVVPAEGRTASAGLVSKKR